ncbi:MAG: GC-type dockerin domain-anchored protein [Planctomycetota bacterium]
MFEAFDLPAGTTSFVVPANSLPIASQLRWSVTTENWRGYAYADFIAFDTGTCPGDVNNDGTVNSADFFAWVNAFNNGDPSGDVNGDGNVDSADFFAWVNAFNNGC